MPNPKAKWKPAPMDQRRVATGRTTPKAKFTRSQLSGSLPESLPHGHAGKSKRPFLFIAGVFTVLIAMSVGLVIAAGSVINAQQQLADIESAAAYYGLPTKPFATLVPDFGNQVAGTTAPISTTPLPLIVNPTTETPVGGGLTVASANSALTEPDGAVDGATQLSSYCTDFGTPTSIDIFDWQDWSTVSLSNALVAQMPISWNASESIWRGYDAAEAFEQPADARDRWRLALHTANGNERWIQIAQSASTPDVVYVYAFQIITPYADAQGRHFGYHPCRAFTLPYSELNVLLSSARAYQSSGSRYPEFAVSDDPRWVRVTVAPVGGSFDLRNVPTLQNNNPVQTVSQATTGFMITDVDWGVWAQLKLGNNVLWVDTSTVQIEAGT